jgi:hypothetical protein
MSDPDTSTSTAAERVRERRSGLAAGQLPRVKFPGSTSQSSITPHAKLPVPMHPGGSHVASQTTNPMPSIITANGAMASPAVNSSLSTINANGHSLDHRRTSKIKATTGSLIDTRQTLADAEPSLADVISMSLGGTPSLSSQGYKRARSRPMQQKLALRPSPQLGHSSQKLAPPPPPVDAEIIDLCSDSDDPMNVDNHALETGPSSSIQSVTAISTGSHPVETPRKGESPGLPPPVFSSPCEFTPPTIPTSSSLPSTSPSRLPLTLASPVFLETIESATRGDSSHSAEIEHTEFPDVTSLLRSDAFESNSAVSSVHGASSRSSSRSLIVGVESRSSNKGSYRTSPPSSSEGSQLSERRSCSAESPAQDLVPSISEVRLHTHMDHTQQESVCLKSSGGDGNYPNASFRLLCLVKESPLPTKQYPK